MATNCLVSLNAAGTYADAFWIPVVGIMVLLGNAILAWPVVSPFDVEDPFGVAKIQAQIADRAKEDGRERGASAVEELKKKMEKESREAIIETVENFKPYGVFDMEYDTYLMLACVVALIQIGVLMLLPNAVTDPRDTWNSYGGVKNVLSVQNIVVQNLYAGGQVLLYVVVLHSYRASQIFVPTWPYKLLWFLSFGYIIIAFVISIVYWPYLVIGGLLLAAILVVTCGMTCIICCLIYPFEGLYSVLCAMFSTCLDEGKSKGAAAAIIFIIYEYFLLVMSIILGWAFVGGPSTTLTNVCVRDVVSSKIAAIMSIASPIIGVLGFFAGCARRAKDAGHKPERQPNTELEIQAKLSNV